MGRRHGPPTKYRPKGHGLGVGQNPMTEPVVATVERAAHLLGCEVSELAEALDGLEPWGHHHDGSAVHRWPELCQAAALAGIEVPPTRPTMDAWRQRPKAIRKRDRS